MRYPASNETGVLFILEYHVCNTAHTMYSMHVWVYIYKWCNTIKFTLEKTVNATYNSECSDAYLIDMIINEQQGNRQDVIMHLNCRVQVC